MIRGVTSSFSQGETLLTVCPELQWNEQFKTGLERDRQQSRSPTDAVTQLSRPTSCLPWLVPSSSLTYSKTISPWQQPGASVVCSLESRLALLETSCLFRRRDEVMSFLKAYPFLVPLLEEAYGKIAEYFETFSSVVLEVITEPEAENDRELFAFIRTGLPVDEALARLERFDEEWWLEASDRAQGKLCIHVEFE